MAACIRCGRDAGYLYSICDECRRSESPLQPARDLIPGSSRAVNYAADPIPRTRPKWATAIVVFIVLSAGYSLLSLTLVLTGVIPLDDAGRRYFNSLSPLDHVLSVAMGALNLAGAVYLFRLRRQAFYLFLAAFLLGVSLTVYQMVTTNFVAVMAGSGMIGFLFGQGLMATIVLYTYILVRRGAVA